jgi:meso-butanediol dehydrogenase / (S,S)-butanediol dehydrogenase / diacetyl reductase
MRLLDKVSLITGGGTGIGAATARLMAKEGAAVCVTGRRLEPLNDVVRTIEGSGGRAMSFPCDVTIQQDCRQAVEETVKRFGRLDILVNNAGTSAVGTALDTDLDQWHQVMNTNATATFLMCRFALPHLIAAGGSIVNIASVSGIRGNPKRPAYNASKGAVCNLTKNLAVDFGPQGVRVNAVLPGLVETDMPQHFMTLDGRPWDQVVADALPKYPLGRIGKAEDIAPCVVFLASGESAWITGQLIGIDGGLTCGLL